MAGTIPLASMLVIVIVLLDPVEIWDSTRRAERENDLTGIGKPTRNGNRLARASRHGRKALTGLAILIRTYFIVSKWIVITDSRHYPFLPLFV
jgi:hypothetical protein